MARAAPSFTIKSTLVANREPLSCWLPWHAAAKCSTSVLVRVGLRCLWRTKESRSTASKLRQPWSRTFAGKTAALRCRSLSFADVAVISDYLLVFSVVNTFLLLPSNEEQRRCFRNVAKHLAPGGLFLLEIFEAGNETISRQTRESTDRSRKRSKHFVDTPNGLRLYAVEISPVTIPELDAMAAGAELRLRDRWSNWKREPFQQSSHRHISVYERV